MQILDSLRRLIGDFRLRADTLDRRLVENGQRLDAVEDTLRHRLDALEETLRQLPTQGGEPCPGPSEPSLPANVQRDMPYYAMCVQGCTYFYHHGDQIIPSYMIATGQTFSEENMLAFVRLADSLFYHGQPPKDGVFLEIGANIGTTTVYMKKKCKPELKFLTFEPVEDNARLLLANCAINGILPDVTVVHAALSDENRSQATIYVNAENRGGSGLVEVWEGDGPLEETCTLTLDSYLRRQPAGPIRYAWIDTEGHEYRVLRGARETFLQRRIPTVLEYNQGVYRDTGVYEDMLALLGELFSSFLVCSDVAAGRDAPRPISELPLVWEEQQHLSCDLILF